MKRRILLVSILLVGFSLQASAQSSVSDLLRDGFQYRNLGPFRVGIWVTDITPLREMQDAWQSADAYFFAIESKARRREGALGNYPLYGDRLAVTPNEPNGLTMLYYLKEAAKGKITLTITDVSGKAIRTLDGATKAGLNRVVLPLLDFGQQFGGGRGGNAPPPITPGEYTVTLQANGKQFTPQARVLAPKPE